MPVAVESLVVVHGLPIHVYQIGTRPVIAIAVISITVITTATTPVPPPAVVPFGVSAVSVDVGGAVERVFILVLVDAIVVLFFVGTHLTDCTHVAVSRSSLLPHFSFSLLSLSPLHQFHLLLFLPFQPLVVVTQSVLPHILVELIESNGAEYDDEEQQSNNNVEG